MTIGSSDATELYERIKARREAYGAALRLARASAPWQEERES